MNGYEEIKAKNYLNDLFGNKKEADFRYSNFDQIRNGLDTWDFQWAYTRFVNSGLSIVPSVNLVKNLGFGEDATHTFSSNDRRANMSFNELETKLKHPIFIIRDKVSDDKYFKNFVYSNFTALKSKLKRVIKEIVK